MAAQGHLSIWFLIASAHIASLWWDLGHKAYHNLSTVINKFLSQKQRGVGSPWKDVSSYRNPTWARQVLVPHPLVQDRSFSVQVRYLTQPGSSTYHQTYEALDSKAMTWNWKLTQTKPFLAWKRAGAGKKGFFFPICSPGLVEEPAPSVGLPAEKILHPNESLWDTII